MVSGNYSFLEITPFRKDLLHNRDGALADERDRYGMGTHAVARDKASGVGGAGQHKPPIVQFRGPAGDLNCLDTSRGVAIRSLRLLTDRC